MPFNRPTLTDLRAQNQSYIETQISGVGKLLRFSNMRVLSDVVSGMAHLHYGYLDYIALQATPATATDEYLAAWGALKSVYRKSASASICAQVTFTGEAGSVIPAGLVLTRSDNYQYTIDKIVTIGSDGKGTGSVTAVLIDPKQDVSGGGVSGNTQAGTRLTLESPPLGVDSTAIMNIAATGGSDIESENSFRERILFAYQNISNGGSKSDFIKWARAVPGVTRAWCVRRIVGAGTVGVYVMTDTSNVNDDGFPSGSDGISSREDWGAIRATGTQGVVADYIYDLQPVTALVFVCSPIKKKVNFEFKGLKEASDDLKEKIRQAINSVFFDVDQLDGSGVILLSELNYALSNITGSTGYIMNQPSNNIQLGIGELPIIGDIQYV